MQRGVEGQMDAGKRKGRKEVGKDAGRCGGTHGRSENKGWKEVAKDAGRCRGTDGRREVQRDRWTLGEEAGREGHKEGQMEWTQAVRRV